MTPSQLKQHMTVKNVFIAIVALNIFHAVSTTQIGGTFQESSKPIVRNAPKVDKAPVAEPGLVAHMLPGEALPPPSDRTSAPAQAVRTKPQSQTTTAAGDPPRVGWIMLLFVGAMALYVRYLMQKAMWNAAAQIGDFVKQAASAASRLKSRTTDLAAKPSPLAQTSRPSPSAPRTAQPVTPRKNTVVRASRWPFAA